jgi:hypothetical protein
VVGGDPSVIPADFRVTEYTTDVSFPTGLVALSDGSILVASTVATDPSNPNYYSSTGEILRFTDPSNTGVADNPSGTVLYSGLPGPLDGMVQAGPYIIVTTETGTITFLHTGATPSSPLTNAGTINLAFPANWEHTTFALAAEPTPGVAGSYNVLFNVGSQYNGAQWDSNGDVIYGSNGIALTEPTTGNVPATGLITSTLSGDSIYMARMTDNNGTPVLTHLTQVATGLRNAASMEFDSAGDLYLADNGIDGNSSGLYGLSTDNLDYIPANEIGVSVPNFGFPVSYTLDNQAPGEPVTVVNPSERVAPLVSFEPLPDANIPDLGSRAQGAAGFALSPPQFPVALSDGVFIGFHGIFDTGGVANNKNPMVFANLATGNYFDFISNDEPNIGHLDGAVATQNALFVSDIASNGVLFSGTPSSGVIYEIMAINQPPVIASIASQTILAGQTLTLNVSATNPDAGETLTYSLVSPPAGAQINPTTGVLTWVPPAGATSATLTVEATNNGSPPQSSTEQFEVTVNPAPPHIAAILAQTVTQGQTLTLQIQATAAGEPITYGLAPGAPSGASINPTTGVFTWTPQVGATTALITVVAMANGSSDLTASESFEVTVLPATPVTSPTSTGGGSGASSTVPTFSLNPVIIAARPKTVQESGVFVDPLHEPWTGTVNYGDGSRTSKLALKFNGSFLLKHAYKRKGDFTITLTLTNALGDVRKSYVTVDIGKKKPNAVALLRRE